ncbi:MAG: hypothetical protein GC191_01835 [Azospirillum sp.]|nr:hypothetical protein [Azospirillum sp.]
MTTIGWDLGGAHLKAALADSEGRLQRVVQVPCPLWQGLDRLEAAVAEATARLGHAERHHVTMTGELADLFADRTEGVVRLAAAMAARLDGEIRLYAGPAGWATVSDAARLADRIASANWYAVVDFVAARVDRGLFLDIGSTTTDVVAFDQGHPRPAGMTDAQRLVADELVYSGVVRTPVMALAARLPYAGAQHGVMAEIFATTADVYRLTGALPDGADQHPSADGRDKSPEASARRLLRQIGWDFSADRMEAVRDLARYLAECQLRRIHDAAARVVSGTALGAEACLVGCGVGRFLAVPLAVRLGLSGMVEFGDLFDASPELRRRAGDCAPAAVLALAHAPP